VFFAPLVSAQEFRATLQGSILDPNRGLVPGAKLTLVNVETPVERETVSDNAWHHLFQYLPPGPFSVTTVATGFMTENPPA